MEWYRMDNTTGYTQEELDALNVELDMLLEDYKRDEPNITTDELNAIIKQHNDEVARR